ncbi:hypothetical protein PENTCL1PPCAC_18964, partial [Pristionchus entomophagus]
MYSIQWVTVEEEGLLYESRIRRSHAACEDAETFQLSFVVVELHVQSLVLAGQNLETAQCLFLLLPASFTRLLCAVIVSDSAFAISLIFEGIRDGCGLLLLGRRRDARRGYLRGRHEDVLHLHLHGESHLLRIHHGQWVSGVLSGPESRVLWVELHIHCWHHALSSSWLGNGVGPFGSASLCVACGRVDQRVSRSIP